MNRGNTLQNTSEPGYPTALSAWLDKATHGLCAEAVERVCREVVEHCKASIEAKLAAGMPLAEVDCAVMAELGSWRAARRRFRRTLLTTWDLKQLAYINGRPVEGLYHPWAVSRMLTFCGGIGLLTSMLSAFSETSLQSAIFQWSLSLVYAWILTGSLLGGLFYRWRPELGEKRVLVFRAQVGSVIAALGMVLAALNLAAIPGADPDPWSEAWWHLIAPSGLPLILFCGVYFDVALSRKLPHVSKPVAP